MGNCFIELKQITKRIDELTVLNDISIQFNSGEVHGIFGSNGAGKSMLVKILSGILQPDSGSIDVEGKTCIVSNPREAQKLGIVAMFQEPNLIPALSVAENLFLGAWPKQGKLAKTISWKQMYAEADKCLERIGLDISSREIAGKLNRGQQRMVEIAKAFNGNAKLLLLDEPSEGLNSQEMKPIIRAIRKIRDEGIGVIYISHRVEEMMEVCDCITVMSGGKLGGTLSCQDVEVEEKLIKSISQSTLERLYPRIFNTSKRMILQAEHLSTRRGIKDASFHLNKGEVLGIAGFLGSGRSALARALFGADSLTAGRIILNGSEIVLKNPREAVNKGIGYVSDENIGDLLFWNMTSGQNITISNMKEVSNCGHLIPGKDMEVYEYFNNRLAICESEEDKRIATLSSGNRQKVLLCKWLFSNCRILIMDEPTSYIDKSAKVEIYNLINRLTLDGNSVVLISSDFDELMGMSDRILVLQDGTIRGSFQRNEFSLEAILGACKNAE